MTEVSKFSKKELFLFSIPSILSSLLTPIIGLVDTALIGNVNTKWLAALSIATILISSMGWVVNFLVHATTQKIAENFGKNDPHEIYKSIGVSIIASLTCGIVMAICLISFKSFWYSLAGGQVDIYKLIDAYFIPRAIFMPIEITLLGLISVLRGIEKVKESFYIIAASTFINVFSSYFFLHVLNLEILSVALGTILSNFFALIFCFYIISKRYKISSCIRSALKDNSSGWFEFGKNSMHIFVRSFFLTGCFFSSTKAAANMGVTSLAAHQILMQLWLFFSFFIDGIAVTANIYCAQIKGSKNFNNLKILIKNLVIISLYFGVVFCLIFLIGNKSIVSIFTFDAEVKSKIMDVFYLVAFTQPLVVIAYTMDGILIGLEEFKFIRNHIIIGSLIIFLPNLFFAIYKNELLYLWLGIFMLAMYRGAAGFIKTRKYGINHE